LRFRICLSQSHKSHPSEGASTRKGKTQGKFQ
jgi:hypothetical protein